MIECVSHYFCKVQYSHSLHSISPPGIDTGLMGLDCSAFAPSSFGSYIQLFACSSGRSCILLLKRVQQSQVRGSSKVRFDSKLYFKLKEHATFLEYYSYTHVKGPGCFRMTTTLRALKQCMHQKQLLLRHSKQVNVLTLIRAQRKEDQDGCSVAATARQDHHQIPSVLSLKKRPVGLSA